MTFHVIVAISFKLRGIVAHENMPIIVENDKFIRKEDMGRIFIIVFLAFRVSDRPHTRIHFVLIVKNIFYLHIINL